MPRATPALRGSSGTGSLLVLELALLAGLLLVALFPRLYQVEHFTGSFDEGVRAQQLLLMERGYRPFRDIFASQGPLLLDLLFPLYLLFGKTLGAARLGVSLLSLVAIVGAWWTARSLHPAAGFGSALLLAVSPMFLENSRLALAEVPSLAPCLWAIGCALRWQRGGRAVWIVLALLLGALGVLIKPMAIPALVPIALLAAGRRPLRPGAVLLGAAFAGLATCLVVALLGAGRVYEVLASYRGGAQHMMGSEALANWALIGKSVAGSERWGLLALVAAGTLLGLRSEPRHAIALISWPVAQALLFLLYTDLSDKHVVYLVPPLALVAGLTFSGLARAVSEWRGGRTLKGGLTSLVAGLAIGLYLTTIPALGKADEELLRDADDRVRRDYAGTLEQAALMEVLVPAEGFVLTDNPLAAFFARRMVPPWLVDTSGTRIEAGSLTSEVAIREATFYQPAVVVTLRRRLGKLVGFNTWLAAGYVRVGTYPGTDPSTPLQVFVRSDLEAQARAFLAARQPPQPSSAWPSMGRT